ncbi:MAG: hypothetical protein WBA45_01910 [Microthrixaceae bacterium]
MDSKQSAERRRASDDPLPDFDVFSAEPGIFGWLSKRGSKGRILLVAPLAILTIGLLLAQPFEGAIWRDHSVTDLCHDAAHLMGLTRVACYNAPVTTEYPFMRDILMGAAAIIMAISPFLVYWQWRSLRVVLSGLAKQRLIARSDQDRSALRSEIDKCNRHFARVAKFHGPYAFFGLVAVLAVVYAASKYGVFEIFTPDGAGTEAGVTNFKGWWANPLLHPVGGLIFISVCSLGVYYILVMNLVGGRVVVALWRTRASIECQADPDNVDGYWGYRNARGVLVPTFTALALHGFALAFVAASVPFPLAIVFLLPLLGQWLFVLPFYIGVPSYILLRDIPHWREAELEKLGAQMRDLKELAANDLEYSLRVAPIQERVKRVRAVRSLPFRRFQDGLVVPFTVITGLASVYALYLAYRA